MAGYAYTVIVGNVGRDPEMRYTGSGVPVCSFSVAVTERWTDRQTSERKEKTTWYRVSAWRGLAETCNTYVKKGMPILVAGQVSVSAYQDQSGQPAATLELTARDVQFLGSRADREGGGEGGYDDFAPPDKMDDIPF
ncbi:MAG: single-stranded DNA-binding protein [Chloroflexi bacterium]|nr:single-stranded DNA-binding protein [Chloroflexota bacterium]